MGKKYVPKADTPAHTPGIKQGNSKGSYESQVGHLPDGRDDGLGEEVSFERDEKTGEVTKMWSHSNFLVKLK